MADTIKKLKDIFKKFPSVGPRTASRFVFHLISLPQAKKDEFIQALQELKNNVKLCAFCFNPHETSGQLCEICVNPGRDKQKLCVVEKETDLIAIENTKRYKGLYFILGGVITLRKSQNDLRIKELLQRLQGIAEVIIALNPTPEGRATAVTVERELKALPNQNFKITHLAKGLPVGGELEYADEETLESAFEGRK